MPPKLLRGYLYLTFFLFIFLSLMVSNIFASGPAPPEDFTVVDNANDDGMKILLTWTPSPDEDAENASEKVVLYRLERKGPDDDEYVMLKELPIETLSFLDDTVEDNINYEYTIYSVAEDGTVSEDFLEGKAIASPQLFNKARVNVLIALMIFFVIFAYFIVIVKMGKRELFIRSIAGLEAVDDAVGRATEMGKPILFLTGLHDISDISTIAAVTILGKIALKTAEYESGLIVPCYDPITMTICQETVEQAYISAGHPDGYNDDMVFYLTNRQFAFVAGVDGIMIREKPAANFFMGYYYAESLILAETGAATGAIQIAGTDAVTQLPFFITACDYCLIGEELYAASAYLSREPIQLASLKAQDYCKFIIATLIFTGVVLTMLGIEFFQRLFISY